MCLLQKSYHETLFRTQALQQHDRTHLTCMLNKASTSLIAGQGCHRCEAAVECKRACNLAVKQPHSMEADLPAMWNMSSLKGRGTCKGKKHSCPMHKTCGDDTISQQHVHLPHPSTQKTKGENAVNAAESIPGCPLYMVTTAAAAAEPGKLPLRKPPALALPIAVSLMGSCPADNPFVLGVCTREREKPAAAKCGD